MECAIIIYQAEAIIETKIKSALENPPLLLETTGTYVYQPEKLIIRFCVPKATEYRIVAKLKKTDCREGLLTIALAEQELITEQQQRRSYAHLGIPIEFDTNSACLYIRAIVFPDNNTAYQRGPQYMVRGPQYTVYQRELSTIVNIFRETFDPLSIKCSQRNNLWSVYEMVTYGCGCAKYYIVTWR